MKHLRWFIMICCLTAAITACLAEDATLGRPDVRETSRTAGTTAGDDRSTLPLCAAGIGFAPNGATGGQALALAREAALVVAERNLLAALLGVCPSAKTTHLEGMLQGAIVVSEASLPDGSYQVVLALFDPGMRRSAD